MVKFEACEKCPHSLAGDTSVECEYCAQELPLITHQSFDVYVASGWLFADVCPMCGRELKGE